MPVAEHNTYVANAVATCASGFVRSLQHYKQIRCLCKALKGRMSVHLCYKTHWFLPMILMVKKNVQYKSPSQALSVILRQDCQPMKTSFQWIQFVLPGKCCGYIPLVMSDEEKAIFLKQRTWCIPVQNKRQSMTVCAYCSIVVENCSKKAMWCKMQRGQ